MINLSDLQQFQVDDPQEAFRYQETIQKLSGLETLRILKQCIQNNDQIWFERLFPLLDHPRHSEFLFEDVVKQNWTSTVQMLLENAVFTPTQNAVKQAIKHPDKELFQFLLPKVYQKGKQNHDTFFLELAIEQSDWTLFEQLLDYFDPNASSCKLLFQAVSDTQEPKSTAIFRLFDLAKQYDPRYLDSALSLAVRGQNVEILSVLFEKYNPQEKIDLFILDAADQESAEVTGLLLGYQPEKFAIRHAFVRAANYGHWEVVQYYLDHFTTEELDVAHIEQHPSFSIDLNLLHLQSLVQQKELQTQTPFKNKNKNRPRL